MIYDLGTEISGLKTNDGVKRKLFNILKDIIKKPGQMKAIYHDSIITINIETDEYIGSITVDGRNSQMMLGGFKGKNKPISVVLKGLDVSVRYIEHSDEDKGLFDLKNGIYEIRIANDGEKSKKIVTFYDEEALDAYRNYKNDNTISGISEDDLLLAVSDPIRKLLELRGLIPDYEGSIEVEDNDIEINPEYIVNTLKYYTTNVPNESVAEAPKF